MQFVRKAEEAITGKKDESHESTKSSSHGPHSSNLANKLDPRVDSGKENHTDATGAGLGVSHDTTIVTGTHGTHDATQGTRGVSATGATSSTNAVPHSPHIANKADPAVDSNHDNRARHEAGLTGAGTSAGLASTHVTTATGTQGSALGSGTTHGISGVTGTSAGLGSTKRTAGSTNVGPHSSTIANKLDLRVDSDRDNRARHESFTSAGLGSTHGTSGVTGAGADAGLASTHATATATGPISSTLATGTGTPHITPIATPGGSSMNVRPHSSNIGVDSGRDTRPQQHSTIVGAGPGTTTHESHTRGATVGSAIGGSGLDTAGSIYNTPPIGTTTGATGTTGTTGPHSSTVADKLDPRVDSDSARAKSEGLHRQI
ncbi:hypothetical protein VN97_g8189 [Penicillium thymicola]|uniref:Uncharacterized protein n=1 Tax=Penicillium thymicola TaxID=293382 RepID=A0AAI9TDV6_PENTH|nr:hypothetical protein VN97_g8189 [Penicillium thymicola]